MPWPLAVYLLAVSAGAWYAAGLVVVAAITAGGTYLVAQRASSGDIRRTSPDKLWDVTEDIRLALTSRLEKTEARLEKAEARIDDLLAEVRALKAQLRDE